ncbi:hypothetical protein [Acidiphilium rubrum]|uniref:hypothetical protein n=1 Tax=Acidiphilium rubrum TaxID=526 RepID=UPI001C37C8FA|nr:hypothetical protein [Acidiphilium rubrum]
MTCSSQSTGEPFSFFCTAMWLMAVVAVGHCLCHETCEIAEFEQRLGHCTPPRTACADYSVLSRGRMLPICKVKPDAGDILEA